MGWLQSSMLYDLADAPPSPGTLLESIFLLVAKKRLEAQYHSTKSMVVALLSKDAEPVNEALSDYRNALFPYLEKSKQVEDAKRKEALEAWAAKKAFKVTPLVQGVETRRLASRLRKQAQRVAEREEKLQSTSNLRRI